MGLDLKKMGFTKRSAVLLVVLAVVAGYYLAAGNTDPPKPQPVQVNKSNSGPVAPTVAQAPNVPAAPAQTQALPGQQPPVRDPFSVPEAYRYSAAPVGQMPATENVGVRFPGIKAVSAPQLQGTVIGSESRSAILVQGSEGRSVMVGESMGGFTLVEVGADYAVMNGPGGPVTLQVGR